MKNKMILFLILGAILVLLTCSSVYVDFIASNSEWLDYLLIVQMFLGIGGALITLFMGLNAFEKKENYELLFIAFLEVLLVLAVVVLNYVYGYKRVIDYSDYSDYMGYISMEFNIIIYMIFVCVMGLLALNLFIKEKLSLSKGGSEEKA